MPGIAPAAKQMGRQVAHAIKARIASRATSPFLYRDYGNLATISRMAAIVQVARLELRDRWRGGSGSRLTCSF